MVQRPQRAAARLHQPERVAECEPTYHLSTAAVPRFPDLTTYGQAEEGLDKDALKLDLRDRYPTLIVDDQYHPNEAVVYRNAYVYENNYPSTYYQHYQPVQSPLGPTGYVINAQQNSPLSAEEGSGSLGHTARTPRATLDWLSNNYEPYEGASLPRCTLYEHYTKHCEESGLEPMNAASFGKLIRSVFKGLKTRRLGNRGHSKYHYNGIRIKEGSRLNDLVSHEEYSRMNQHNGPRAIVDPYLDERSAAFTEVAYDPLTIAQQEADLMHPATPRLEPAPPAQSGDEFARAQYQLGQAELQLVRVELEEAALAAVGLGPQHYRLFCERYAENCSVFLGAVKNLDLTQAEAIWSAFWSASSDLKGLSAGEITGLCSLEPVIKYIYSMDVEMYQAVFNVLIPDVLSPYLKYVVEDLRKFNASLERSLKKALCDAPAQVLKAKEKALVLFNYTFKRYMCTSHFANSARDVLADSVAVQTMHQELSRIELWPEAGWVTQCDQVLVSTILNDFKEKLLARTGLEEWAQWMEKVLDQVLAKYHDKSAQVQAAVAKRFLIRWSYYADCIIRDLTLAAAKSFGSFHLMRHLYAEFMLHLIASRIAKLANQPVITIYGGVFNNPHHNNNEQFEPAWCDDLGRVEENGFDLAEQVDELGMHRMGDFYDQFDPGHMNIVYIRDDEDGREPRSHNSPQQQFIDVESTPPIQVDGKENNNDIAMANL